jgi:hypothetical protein
VRIEVLYIPGCPHHQPTVERVRNVLASEMLADEVSEVPVKTEGEAQSLCFPGSPTVRVNGKDVEPTRTVAPMFACRLYTNGTGVPPDDMLRAAILQAKPKD